MTKLCEINFEEFEFEFLQRDGHPILMADFWCRAAELFFEESGLEKEPIDYVYTYKNEGFVNKNKKAKLIRYLEKDSIKNTIIIIDKTKEAITKFQYFLDKLPKLKKLSNEQLILLWRKFDRLHLRIIPYFFLPYYISEKNMISNKINLPKEVEKITDKHNALGILTFPKEKLAFQREQESKYNLIKNTNNKAIEKHLKEFAWMKTFILLPKNPLSKKELIQELKKIDKHEFIEEYEFSEKQRRKNKLIRKRLESLLDGNQLALVNLSRELGQVLSWSIDEALRIYCELQVLFKEVSKRANISFNEWSNYTSKELISLIRGKNIKKHSDKFVFISIDSQRTIIEDKNAEKIVEKLEPEKRDVKKVTGRVAYKGFVKGKVRLCLNPEKSKELLDDEILVTAMTSPDYITAMKRCSAIVTDEGGLLCHAAIIAREFKKPCIIGTKDATKVFKTGDFVIVDAEKGFVEKGGK